MLAHQPENEEEFPILKLCDFGISQKIGPDGRVALANKIGTIGYMAPELGQQKTIDCAVDMWSFGILLYELACAYKPTGVKGYKYGSGPIPFVARDWRQRSKALQNLITRCLEVDPSKRITAQEALAHYWFTERSQEPIELTDQA